MATEDGFVIAIAYGSRTGWLKNVLASGSATIVYEGGTSPVEHPEVIPIVAATTYFPAKARRAFHRYRVTQCIRLRRTERSRDEARGDLFQASR